MTVTDQHPDTPPAAEPSGRPAGPWITEPGQYELTDEEYHRDPVVGGSLSSTGARELLRPGGPARFAYWRENRRPDKYEFDVGRALHTLALGVGSPVVVVPVVSRRGKDWTEAEREARAAGATPLPEPEADKVHAMAAALRDHEVVGQLLDRPGRAETSWVGRCPETGVMGRARIDWLPDVPDGERQLLIDVKTTKDADPEEGFPKSVANYGYHQQGPFYGDVLTWNGAAPHGWKFVLVAVEKEPPYLVSYGEPDDESIWWGQVLNRKARAVYRRCMATGEWPGYSTDPAEFRLPGWLRARYEADYANGRFDIAADLDLIGDPTA